jgi:serine/threonine-protein kinase
VGLYLDAYPHANVHEVVIDTSTPGFSARIYARNSTPNRDTFAGWTPLTSVASVAGHQRVAVNTGGRTYRYYLIWITRLPPNQNLASVNEVTLYHVARGQ